MHFTNPKRIRAACSGLLVALFFLIPIAYVIMIAFEPPNHFITNPLTPVLPTLSNFGAAWQQGDLGPEVGNTVLYSVLAAGVSTALGLLVAFPIAFFDPSRLLALRLLRGRALLSTTGDPAVHRVTLAPPLR